MRSEPKSDEITRTSAPRLADAPSDTGGHSTSPDQCLVVDGVRFGKRLRVTSIGRRRGDARLSKEGPELRRPDDRVRCQGQLVKTAAWIESVIETSQASDSADGRMTCSTRVEMDVCSLASGTWEMPAATGFISIYVHIARSDST